MGPVQSRQGSKNTVLVLSHQHVSAVGCSHTVTARGVIKKCVMRWKGIFFLLYPNIIRYVIHASLLFILFLYWDVLNNVTVATATHRQEAAALAHALESGTVLCAGRVCTFVSTVKYVQTPLVLDQAEAAVVATNHSWRSLGLRGHENRNVVLTQMPEQQQSMCSKIFVKLKLLQEF